jgi:hypothetical protein
MKRKWLKVLLMLMMAFTSFASPMNPREIEDVMRIMHENRTEFTLSKEDHDGELN